jgi:hypothetical protein
VTAGTIIAMHSIDRLLAPPPAPAAGDSAPKTEYKKEYQWGLYVTSHPTDQQGDPKLTGNSIVDIPDATNNNPTGQLSVHVVAVQYPDPAKTVVASELQNGIPEDKILFIIPFQQKARAEYDGDKAAFAHPNDMQVPTSGFSGTPVVQVSLKFFVKTLGPWKEGESPPPPPPSPDISDSPDADSAKNISPNSGPLGFVGEWSAYGWSWIGAYKKTSTFQWSIPSVLQWNPGNQEGKTSTVSLIWGLNRAVRSRTIKKEPGGLYEPVGLGDGWSDWMPD